MINGQNQAGNTSSTISSSSLPLSPLLARVRRYFWHLWLRPQYHRYTWPGSTIDIEMSLAINDLLSTTCFLNCCCSLANFYKASFITKALHTLQFNCLPLFRQGLFFLTVNYSKPTLHSHMIFITNQQQCLQDDKKRGTGDNRKRRAKKINKVP